MIDYTKPAKMNYVHPARANMSQRTDAQYGNFEGSYRLHKGETVSLTALVAGAK